MAEHVMILKIDETFYQEFAEQGAAHEALLEQLKLDIQDQVDDFDLQQLMTRMLSSEYAENMLIFAPKKRGEGEHPSHLLVVGHDV